MMGAGTEVELPGVIADYFTCANTKRWVAMSELFTDDAELTAVGARRRHGREDIAEFYQKTTAAWKMNTDTPTRCIRQGATAVVEIHFHGVDHRGRSFEFEAVDVFDLRNGKIRRVSIWYDIAAVRGFLSTN